MDLKGSGLEVQVNAAEQSDEWLLSAAAEIAEAAKDRGLVLPTFAGSVAVEAAASTDVVSEPVVVSKETFEDQIDSAYSGYYAVVNAINGGRGNKWETVDDAHLAQEFEDWFTDEKLDYVVKAMEKDPELRFTLVATPNIIADHKDIIKAAKAFGKNQPYGTYVYEDLYERHAPEVLSGTRPDSGTAVRFSLMPNKFQPELSGTVEQQRKALNNLKLQADRPGMELHVPSVLEAVTFWQTLRVENGGSLQGEGTFDKTYIRHFDLPEQRFDGWLYVPNSCVRDRGKPYLYYSYVDNDDDGRVSVG